MTQQPDQPPPNEQPADTTTPPDQPVDPSIITTHNADRHLRPPVTD